MLCLFTRSLFDFAKFNINRFFPLKVNNGGFICTCRNQIRANKFNQLLRKDMEVIVESHRFTIFCTIQQFTSILNFFEEILYRHNHVDFIVIRHIYSFNEAYFISIQNSIDVMSTIVHSTTSTPCTRGISKF